MPFVVTELVAPDLYHIATHQHPRLRGYARDIYRLRGTQHHLITAHLKHGVLRTDAGVFEKINVRLLTAADGRLRLIEDELLACQRTGADINPAIFQRAFDKANGCARGKPEQGKSYRAADRATLHLMRLMECLNPHADGVE